MEGLMTLRKCEGCNKFIFTAKRQYVCPACEAFGKEAAQKAKAFNDSSILSKG
jgi:Zn finger protein HypA/HybF involved in hydrogenase expression